MILPLVFTSLESCERQSLPPGAAFTLGDGARGFRRPLHGWLGWREHDQSDTDDKHHSNAHQFDACDPILECLHCHDSSVSKA